MLVGWLVACGTGASDVPARPEAAAAEARSGGEAVVGPRAGAGAGAVAGGGAGAGPGAGGDVAHDATPHAHATGHGGEVVAMPDGHAEARFTKSGVMVWLTDAASVPVGLDGVRARAEVRTDAGVREVEMVAMGDHLHAALPLVEGTGAEARVTVERRDGAATVTFRTDSVGSLVAHDHTALHGGVVTMWGDVHVEYRADGDTVRFWVTDARRVAIRDGVRGVAVVEGRRVPLRFEAEDGVLVGEARAAAGARVMLEAEVRGAAVTVGFGG